MFSLFVFLLGVGLTSAKGKREFYVDWKNNRFIKDGKAFQYVSGGMHYFRIPPEYWEERIMAAKSAGLNAIQSYAVWNEHEPSPGIYNFEGGLDIVRFIKTVHENNMALILRVGPYICAEWNYGGLPPWLLGIPGIQIRTRDKKYLRAVEQWLKVLLPKIKPYLYSNGGPIIMVQVENEYGSFGCDHSYVNTLYEMFYRILGNEVVYFTTDGDREFEVRCGVTPPNMLGTIDFRPSEIDNLDQILGRLRKYQPNGPMVNSELYAGKCDWMGQSYVVTKAGPLGVMLDTLLSRNMSVNFYMWHGGSTTGLNTGASHSDDPDGGIVFSPQSYDFNAPVTEHGDIRPDKYWAVRNVIEKHFPGNKLPVPPNSKKLSGIALHPLLDSRLTDQIGPATHLISTRNPVSMESLGVFEGVVAYQHKVGGATPEKKGTKLVRQRNCEERRDTKSLEGLVAIQGVRDRAYVIVDGIFVKVVRRDEDTVNFTISASESITILVENMGYVNYGKEMKAEYKGIKGVTINGVLLESWSHYKIDIRKPLGYTKIPTSCAGDKVKEGSFNGKQLLRHGPTVFIDTFTLKRTQLMDTFINITQYWSKGFLIVNDIIVGRYWPDAGPQFTYYIPGVWLREGVNTVILIEMQSYTTPCQSDHSESYHSESYHSQSYHSQSDHSSSSFYPRCAGAYLTDTPYLDGPVNPRA